MNSLPDGPAGLTPGAWLEEWDRMYFNTLLPTLDVPYDNSANGTLVLLVLKSSGLDQSVF